MVNPKMGRGPHLRSFERFRGCSSTLSLMVFDWMLNFVSRPRADAKSRLHEHNTLDLKVWLRQILWGELKGQVS
jgi:hypothetical protein